MDYGSNRSPFPCVIQMFSPKVLYSGLEMVSDSIVCAATRGKVMYQIPALLSPAAASVTLSGRVSIANQ